MHKYGIICYDTINIGDEIQTIAIRNVLRKINISIDYYVIRDNMNRIYDAEYRPVDLSSLDTAKTKIYLFVSGWLSEKFDSNHHPYVFPPPKCIHPIFISVHMTNDYLSQVVDKHADYFRKYGPIGCRDYSTLHKLNQRKIPAYFSGCATLTLSVSDFCESKNPSTDSIYVDVKPHISAKNITHIYRNPRDMKQRFQLAEDLLKKYISAKAVHTSRLHCYLPCTAFDVPVKFINPNPKDARFDGLIGRSKADYQMIRNNFHTIIKKICDDLNVPAHS